MAAVRFPGAETDVIDALAAFGESLEEVFQPASRTTHLLVQNGTSWSRGLLTIKFAVLFQAAANRAGLSASGAFELSTISTSHLFTANVFLKKDLRVCVMQRSTP